MNMEEYDRGKSAVIDGSPCLGQFQRQNAGLEVVQANEKEGARRDPRAEEVSDEPLKRGEEGDGRLGGLPTARWKVASVVGSRLHAKE